MTDGSNLTDGSVSGQEQSPAIGRIFPAAADHARILAKVQPMALLAKMQRRLERMIAMQAAADLDHQEGRDGELNHEALVRELRALGMESASYGACMDARACSSSTGDVETAEETETSAPRSRQDKTDDGGKLSVPGAGRAAHVGGGAPAGRPDGEHPPGVSGATPGTLSATRDLEPDTVSTGTHLDTTG